MKLPDWLRNVFGREIHQHFTWNITVSTLDRGMSGEQIASEIKKVLRSAPMATVKGWELR